MVDRNLFEFVTKSTGHSLDEAAEAMGLSRSGLSRRLNGEIQFRHDEMAKWLQLTGTKDAGPVFFAEESACTHSVAHE